MLNIYIITLSLPCNSQRRLATHQIVWLGRFYIQGFPWCTRILDLSSRPSQSSTLPTLRKLMVFNLIKELFCKYTIFCLKTNILSPFFLFICSRKYIAGRNRTRNFATLFIGLWLERRRWWALLSLFMVGIVGSEPTAYRIWICCSTTELYPNFTGSKCSEY